MNDIKVMIENGNTIYIPITTNAITWQTQRKGVAGTFKFDVVQDDVINCQEGNPISFIFNGQNVFFGFVFSKKSSKKDIVSVVAYDQLRYLKNKDTYVYENKTASEFIKMIARDFRLQIGDIEDTSYKIPSQVEDNEELFQMVQNALDLTMDNKNELYILYDDFGKITLKNISNMVIPIMLDAQTIEDFTYESSIDKNTYNKIKLVYDNEQTGKRDIFIAQHSDNINKWGVLQQYDTIKKHENGKIKADTLLSIHNRKTRTLSIKNAIGDIRVRAGTLIYINLSLEDREVNHLMLVEKCTHTFKGNEHLMDLTMVGGGFVGG